jgi:hypothetical protein
VAGATSSLESEFIIQSIRRKVSLAHGGHQTLNGSTNLVSSLACPTSVSCWPWKGPSSEFLTKQTWRTFSRNPMIDSNESLKVNSWALTPRVGSVTGETLKCVDHACFVSTLGQSKLSSRACSRPLCLNVSIMRRPELENIPLDFATVALSFQQLSSTAKIWT